MPIGIVESAVVIAAVSGTYKFAKKRSQRARRRSFFKAQHQSALNAISAENETTTAEVAPTANAEKAAETATPMHTGDNPEQQNQLENIWGIGPIFVERLNGAGIFTYADLASQSTEDILAIVSSSDDSPRPSVEKWIEQAASLAMGE